MKMLLSMGLGRASFHFSCQGLILATAELATDEVMGRQSSSKGGKGCEAKLAMQEKIEVPSLMLHFDGVALANKLCITTGAVQCIVFLVFSKCRDSQLEGMLHPCCRVKPSKTGSTYSVGSTEQLPQFPADSCAVAVNKM